MHALVNHLHPARAPLCSGRPRPLALALGSDDALRWQQIGNPNIVAGSCHQPQPCGWVLLRPHATGRVPGRQHAAAGQGSLAPEYGHMTTLSPFLSFFPFLLMYSSIASFAYTMPFWSLRHRPKLRQLTRNATFCKSFGALHRVLDSQQILSGKRALAVGSQLVRRSVDQVILVVARHRFILVIHALRWGAGGAQSGETYTMRRQSWTPHPDCSIKFLQHLCAALLPLPRA